MSLSRVMENSPSSLLIQSTRQADQSSAEGASGSGWGSAANSSTEQSPFQTTLAAAEQSRLDRAAPRTSRKAGPKPASLPKSHDHASAESQDAPSQDPPPASESAQAAAPSPEASDKKADPAKSADAATTPSSPDPSAAAGVIATAIPTPPSPAPSAQAQTDPAFLRSGLNPDAAGKLASAIKLQKSAASPAKDSPDASAPKDTATEPQAAPDATAKPAAHEKPARLAFKLGTPGAVTPESDPTATSDPALAAALPAPTVATGNTSADAASSLTASLPPAVVQAKSPVPDPISGIVAQLSPGHLTPAASAEAAPAAQVPPRADTPDPMDQVVLGLKDKFDVRAGKAQITLDPPNLGTVKVAVSLDNGILTAEFHSDSNVVRDLLKGNLDKLKTVLEGQGVAVDRLAVATPPAADPNAAHQQGQQPSFGSPNHDGRSAGQYQQEPRPGQRQQDPSTFARLFRQAQDAPIDLVA